MKEQRVTITDTRITYSDNPNQVVMDAVSKDLMKAYSNIVCQNKGKVLDVGFGLGYSADAIYNTVGNYTCIEINPQIYQEALKWAENKSNVKIYLGDWIKVIPEMAYRDITFDGIFMDTYGEGPETYTLFENYAKTIANPNCVLSIYSYHGIRNPEELHNHYFEINNEHRLNYPRKFEKGHNINWTYYNEDKSIFEKKEKSAAI